MIGFGDAVARYYKNYFNFYGRASRAEYWWPVLMQLIVYAGVIIAIVALALTDTHNDNENINAGLLITVLAGAFFMVLNIIPSYSVAARRFHDLDQTGWLVLVFAIANAFLFVSVFAQLIWFALPGTDGPNQYGPDPHGYDADIFG